ncbi:MAG: radical SAM protein [Phycisphaerae bacterium]|jgi:MoaA/NifB/PqqE/SkfB family radical SAM enzyme
MRILQLAASILRNRRGAVPRPSWCTYIVTYRCNARCGMCDSWQVPAGDELTPAQVADVFGKLGRLDIVRLTGGEPFLRKDLPEIAETILARSRPTVLHITTNGSFPDRAVELVERCSASRRLRFMVSLDGLAETHDANRGKHATFAQAIDTVRRLVTLRPARGIEVSINHTVISPQSMADNDKLRTLADELGVEVHSVLAYSDSAMYSADLQGQKASHLIVPTGYPLHPDLAGADAVGFVQAELARAGTYRSALLRWGKRYYLRGLLSRLSANGQRGAGPQPRCVALRSHIRILPDGGVPVCQFNTEQVGNLARQSLADVWHGLPSTTARRWVDACPGCWAECEVMPNAIYSGDILRPR